MSLRIAVVGCGSIGERHIGNLSALGVTPVGVDSDPVRRDALASRGVRVHAALEDVGALDAVLICTPATEHARLATDAIAAGLDVFVEKPFATSADDAKRVLELVARTDRVLAVGYNLRFDTGLAALRDALRVGRIGRLLHTRFDFGQYLPDWRPGRDYRRTVSARASTGGGILLEASHELDLLRWLCGEWTAVIAFARRLGDLDVDVEDTVCAVVETSAGVVAEVHLDFLRRGYRRRVECMGTHGTLEWEFSSGVSLTTSAGAIERLADRTDPNDMYVAELREFLERVRDRRAPTVTAEDGFRALELVEAIRSSSASGAAVRR